jgi:hypothetical protein
MQARCTQPLVTVQHRCTRRSARRRSEVPVTTCCDRPNVVPGLLNLSGVIAARIWIPSSLTARTADSAHSTALAGPSNLARNPSPAVSISRPPYRRSSPRTRSRWASRRSAQRRSPRRAACAVDSTMSVNRTARTRGRCRVAHDPRAERVDGLEDWMDVARIEDAESLPRCEPRRPIGPRRCRAGELRRDQPSVPGHTLAPCTRRTLGRSATSPRPLRPF